MTVRPVRLLAVGAGAPDWRLPAREVTAAWGARGGRGNLGVCAPDQDTLTLAWDAASGALDAAGVTPDAVGGLWWGTTRPPFAEGPSHAYLAAALGLHPGAGGALLAGSPAAGMDALFAAWDAVAAGAVALALVVASDSLVPGTGTAYETRCGAGAAAVVLASEGGRAALVRRAVRSRPALDRYRGDREGETRDLYDPRLFREEVFVPEVVHVAAALELATAARWSLPDPDGRLGRVVARRLDAGTPASATVEGELGDTGAAAALLGALPALGEPGPVVLVSYGGGRTAGALLEVEAPVPGAERLEGILTTKREVSYPEALRARGCLVRSGEGVPMGVPPGGAAFVRGNPELLGLLGARCADCGAISTPPSLHPTCVGCGGPKLEPVPLARHGAVHTYVVNSTMPAPFEAPLPLAVVDLDDGARLLVQATEPGGLEIGAPVELVLRRYALERGAPVYGFKARPQRRA